MKVVGSFVIGIIVVNFIDVFSTYAVIKIAIQNDKRTPVELEKLLRIALRFLSIVLPAWLHAI